MKLSKKEIFRRAKKIKIIISDIDGVLTDGSMYYNEKGEYMKKFNTRDGITKKFLERKLKVIFITQEKSMINLQRAKKLKISKMYQGVLKKEDKLSDISKKFDVKLNEIAYIGDDLNDFEIMKKVGLSATPHDGVNEIKKIANYICKTNGGEGAFREFTDLIVDVKR